MHIRWSRFKSLIGRQSAFVQVKSDLSLSVGTIYILVGCYVLTHMIYIYLAQVRSCYVLPYTWLREHPQIWEKPDLTWTMLNIMLSTQVHRVHVHEHLHCTCMCIILHSHMYRYMMNIHVHVCVNTCMVYSNTTPGKMSSPENREVYVWRQTRVIKLPNVTVPILHYLGMGYNLGQ